MSAASRPSIVTLPLVGAVMPARILSNVLLPAPLRPMTPTDAPRGTSKVTFFKAQKLLALRRTPSRYCFPRRSMRTSIGVIPRPPSSVQRV